ncbi:MAG: AMP-binding protein, partial [Algicola sp.]|nr:AMP-binding protein [Algicola sp.]
MWYIDQLEGGSSEYNMPVALRFKGVLDDKLTEQAFAKIIERHEPLRTVFVSTADAVEQLISPDFEFKLTSLDLTDLAADAQNKAVLQAASEDANKPFDLAQDLMLRSTFIRLSPDEGVLLFNMHHIASDGWSMGLLVNEFWAGYEAIKTAKPHPFAPLAVTYADYAQWQHRFIKGQVLQSQLSYWTRQLADLPQVHELPLDRARPEKQTFNGGVVSFEANAATLEGLKQLALQHSATLFMVLHGAFSLLLSRHSNTNDMVLGVPMGNRLQQELEPIIGFFINTFVLRADCSGNPAYSDFLERVKTVNLDAQANQDVPFEHLVERLKPARSRQHSPLFQIMFSMNTNETSTQQLTDVTLSPLEGDDSRQVAKFDLTLDAMATESGLSFEFEFNRDLFDAQTIEVLGQHLVRLLDSIVANPQTPINELSMLSEDEQHYLLHTLNEAVVDDEESLPIHELFERQVKGTPNNIALAFADEQAPRQLTYQALNDKANQLAHYLRAQGVKSDTLVGLSVERSLNMVIALLAILKAGGAYVPLDPDYPQDRLDHMIKDSGVELVLTQKVLADLQPQLLSQPTTNPPRLESYSPNNLAYVIYTSGSTGLPKGVMVEHQSVAAHVSKVIKQLDFTESDQVLQFASVSFDTFIEQSFAA